MHDLHYVGKERDEIKKVSFTEIQIQFMKFVSLQAINEKSGDPCFRKKRNSDVCVKFKLNTIIMRINGRSEKKAISNFNVKTGCIFFEDNS